MRLANFWTWAAAVCVLFCVEAFGAQGEVAVPARGVLRLERSARVRPGVYERAPEAAKPGELACVLRLEGLDGVVLDLRDVVLRGASPSAPLDQLVGCALYLTNCRGVVVRGGTFSGFKVAVVAEQCDGLRIENVRADGNFAQRLMSTALAAEESDQLDRLRNQEGEWRERYGAAIALSDCASPVISGCRVRHGQNGLLLSRCTNARVFDNDFSFLSGWGIALFRSSGNLVTRNRCDYNARGFVEGRYAVGHGAGAIVLVDRSSNNVIAENSATHSSSGLVLHGGEDFSEGLSRERGEPELGGSDRNVVARNHFSNAVLHGIEMSFTRDTRLFENVVSGCGKHGLSGAFNQRATIARNDFTGAGAAGISLPHAQDALIVGNLLERCATGLELFFDGESKQVKGVFGRHEDTASRDVIVYDNSFAGNDFDVAIDRTSGLTFAQNIIASDSADPTVAELTFAEGETPGDLTPKDALRGVLGRWPSGRVRATSVRRPVDDLYESLMARLEFEPFVPAGSTRPFDPSRERNGGQSTLFIGEFGPWDFESREPKPSPRPVGGVLAGALWRARWFGWPAGPDPRGDELDQARWRALADDAPIELDVGVWTDPWADTRDVRLAVGEQRFGLLATTRIELDAGRYRLRVTSDDGVRVRVDDVVRIEDWSWHTERSAEVVLDLAAGVHTLQLEYFQIDGAAALAIDLVVQ